MLNKKGVIEIGFIVFIFLILIIAILQIQTIYSSDEFSSFEPSVMSKKAVSFGGGGGAKKIISKPKDKIKETINTIVEYDSEILNAFENQTKIPIVVILKDTSGIEIIGTKEERIELMRQRDELFKPRVDEVLNTFQKDELELIGKHSSGFDAWVTRENLDKLIINSNVKSISWIKTGSHGTLSQSVPLINVDPYVWNLGYTGDGIKICIIDSGVNASHPALNGKIIDEYCYCTNPEGTNYGCCPNGGDEDNDAEDYDGHGTHVTGIIASQNSTYKGVAYGADFYVVKVTDNKNFINCEELI